MLTMKPMGTPGKCPAHVRPWTASQDELLINMYPHMTYTQIANLLGRTIGAIRWRTTLLHEAGPLTYKKIRLTPEQCSFIRKNRHNMTHSEVAAVLGVPVVTVKEKAWAMGVTYRKCGDAHYRTKYPDSDIELIRQLRDEYNLTFREIGEKFDIQAGVCRYLYTYRQTVADAIAREYLPR
ncbi:AsnC family protein [Salmonella enterica subsp. enterica serovar Lexington]|nr:AsnC family protein [Salmonella enterica]EBJ4578715.1 AsnC family protein [Salmonella enterica]EDW0437249.1 AsnC family protein [Salmonella enterica subsp. enterica serovar Lexington]